MKLTFSQLRRLVRGAALIQENKDGSAFLRRMTPAQIQGGRVADPDGFQGQTAAGITLDFITDAEIVTVTLSGTKKGTRKTMVVDLLVDGRLSRSQSCWFPAGEDKNAVTSYGTHAFAFPLHKGEKRVTVQFNCFCTVDELTLELSDGAAFRPYTHKRSLLAFGDSITQGHTAQHPSRTYASQVGQLLDAEIFNYGISAERFEEAKIIPGTYPECDLVTIAYGTNDFGHQSASEALFARNMPAFLAKAAAEFSHVPVFVILPLWRADFDKVYNSVGSLADLRARIAAEAEKYPNFHVLDGWELIPHDPEYFADRFLHPNEKGMDAYAENLYEKIREELSI